MMFSAFNFKVSSSFLLQLMERFACGMPKIELPLVFSTIVHRLNVELSTSRPIVSLSLKEEQLKLGLVKKKKKNSFLIIFVLYCSSKKEKTRVEKTKVDVEEIHHHLLS